MARETKSTPIINRDCPIFIANETEEDFNLKLHANLRLKGLVSNVSYLGNTPGPRALSRYAMAVSIINSTNDIPYIIETNIGQAGHQHKLILDIDYSGSFDPMGSLSDYRYIKCSSAVEDITSIISSYFFENIDPNDYERQKKREDYGPRLDDLFQRLEVATDAVSDLRINSASEIVSELRDIKQALQIKFRSSSHEKFVSKGELRFVVYEVLTVLARIYDCVENSKVAAIIVSGVTTAIMGCSGLSGAVSVAVMLASWHGKDAFIAAISKINFSATK